MDLQATNNVLCHALLHILACFGRNQTKRAGLSRARPADCLECIGWAFFAHSVPALLPRPALVAGTGFAALLGRAAMAALLASPFACECSRRSELARFLAHQRYLAAHATLARGASRVSGVSVDRAGLAHAGAIRTLEVARRALDASLFKATVELALRAGPGTRLRTYEPEHTHVHTHNTTHTTHHTQHTTHNTRQTHTYTHVQTHTTHTQGCVCMFM